MYIPSTSRTPTERITMSLLITPFFTPDILHFDCKRNYLYAVENEMLCLQTYLWATKSNSENWQKQQTH